MADHLNLFEPYERKTAGHEDALTRAFLLVLRGVPVAHAAWLHLVDKAHRANKGTGVPRLHELSAPQVHMQTSKVPDGVRKVISLVQTDEQVFREGDAFPSDRRQVLDGVVSYGTLAVVVENKPFHGHIWEGQLDVNIPDGVEHDKRVATVTWKDVVLAWGRLLEAGHLGVAETVLLSDFLDYVEAHFPKLRPFSKVALCGQDFERLHRRCAALLDGIAPGHVRWHRGWGNHIRLADGQCALMIGCFPRRGQEAANITVEFDPGDTVAQARRLYSRVALEDVLALDWHAWPNLHVAHMTSNIVPFHGSLGLPDYWKLWAGSPDWIRQWNLLVFDFVFSLMVDQGLAGPEDREAFDRHVTSTNRRRVNLCPGVTLQWRLPLDEAAVLDARGTLESTVGEAIGAGVAALGLKLPQPRA